jgi:FAD/FMN-containing dehydrogenase
LVRHVRTVRVRPGSATVVARCVGRERLIRAAHAFGFFMKRPPSASLVSSVSGSVVTNSRSVAVTVRGDAELGDVRAVVQVQAVCSGAR